MDSEDKSEDILNGGQLIISNQLTLMVDFIHFHYSSKLSLAEIANSGYVSQPSCNRLFK